VVAMVTLWGCQGEELEQCQTESQALSEQVRKLQEEATAQQKVLGETKARLTTTSEQLAEYKDREAAEGKAKEEARAQAQAYAKLSSEIRWRDVTSEEMCAFFFCDSMKTQNDVKRILRDQSRNGKKGWRITSQAFPKGRVERLGNGDVKLLSERVEERQCKKQGTATDVAEGVKGCPRRVPSPGRRCAPASPTPSARLKTAGSASGSLMSGRCAAPESSVAHGRLAGVGPRG
jgi:hypothetical protein